MFELLDIAGNGCVCLHWLQLQLQLLASATTAAAAAEEAEEEEEEKKKLGKNIGLLKNILVEKKKPFH